MARSGEARLEEVLVPPHEPAVALSGTNDPAARDDRSCVLLHPGDDKALERVDPPVEVTQRGADVNEPIPYLDDRVLVVALEDHVRSA